MKYAKWTIEDTGDWQDMLLCGTEVVGSCQNVNGTPTLNVGLLGYLSDGKIRAVVIKDPSGKIVARSLLRILWDDVAKKPVLFRDRTYTAYNLSDEMERAMDEMFRRRACSLGLPLASQEGEGKDYPNALQSLGNPASFEYSDAVRGLTEGTYTVPREGLMLLVS